MVDVVVMLNRDEYKQNVSSLFSVWLTNYRVLEMSLYTSICKEPRLNRLEYIGEKEKVRKHIVYFCKDTLIQTNTRICISVICILLTRTLVLCYCLTLKITAGNCVISADTFASTPKLIKMPRITPQGNQRYAFAFVTVSCSPFALFSVVINLKLLSTKTYVPRWFVRRLSICLSKKHFHTSRQINFIISNVSRIFVLEFL